MQTGKKLNVWLVLFLWLCFAGLVKTDKRDRIFIPESLTYFEIYTGMIVVGLMILRFASYALDYCDALKTSKKIMKKNSDLRKFSLINYIGFGFYLPVFSQGPPIIYANYLDMIKENESGENADLVDRIDNLVREMARLALTCFIAVFMMHFLYTDVVIYEPFVSEL